MPDSTPPGLLSVFDDRPEGRITFLQIDETGIATARNGHVDLGTGIETALAQIVAEELDVPLADVRVILGDTASTPDQGPTIASETIQVAAHPLRLAAAQARQALMGLAARRLNAPGAEVRTEDGRVHWQDASVSYGALVAGAQLTMRLDPEMPVKDPAGYRIVGQPVERRDLPSKLTGEFAYIHDLRLDGMLHGHVVRPPYAGRDSGDFVGHSLITVDYASVAGMAGLVDVVVEGDFVGVVAKTPQQAQAIAEALHVDWHLPPALPPMDRLAQTIKDQPSSPRLLDSTGNFDRGIAECGTKLARTYLWPYHEHGSIGPSCGVADWNEGTPIVWSGTQNPHMLRADLALLAGLAPEQIEVRRLQAAGCYGRNCADDVCGDALLLSRAVDRPVRVQLTRAQEHLWEPKGAAQLMEVEGGIGPSGNLHAYALDSWYPSNRGPNLALLLTGRVLPEPHHAKMGDRTIVPPYRVPHKRIICHDLAPIVRAAWMRGVSALPNTFAHESFIDELAYDAAEDPVAFRLRHLDDPRQADLVRRTAEEAGWHSRSGPRFQRQGRMAYGQGFAYATYVHGAFPGTAAASAAWVCDVAVDTETGEVTLTRVFVGQDQGLVINPDGVRAQIHGNVIQTASRTLTEEVSFDAIAPAAKSWATYPIQSFAEVPEIRTMLVERPGDPALGVGESAAVPAAAAIANAIFDATGIRLREAPFTPEKLRAALASEGLGALSLPPAPPAAPRNRWRPLAALGGALTLGALALPIHSAIPLSRAPAAGQFTPETLARGAEVFGAANCAGCHTSENGQPHAGGRAMQTPFGTVYSTNLTPDLETGLGQWSFAAFERAMRHGISRDGTNLYPVFPYTSFARIEDGDMQALYAYLQTLPPVRAETPRAAMLAPVNLRPVNALWNAMFHDPAPLPSDPTQNEAWNRGRYLVEGAGHCSACHTPRNTLGAEDASRAFGGAMVGPDWAPPLAGSEAGARGWDHAAFAAYLREGHAPGIASASGKMAEVVASLRAVPDADIDAMATYLASQVTAAPLHSQIEAELPPGPASRLFEAACASCHTPGMPGAATAAQLPLTLSSVIRAPRPDAVLDVLRNGIESPLSLPLRDMPAFASELDEKQMDDLAHYLRARFAPDLPAWR